VTGDRDELQSPSAVEGKVWAVGIRHEDISPEARNR
jgi:hypothetical protein